MKHEWTKGDRVVVMSDFGQPDLPGTVVEIYMDGDLAVSINAPYRTRADGNTYSRGETRWFKQNGEMEGYGFGLTIRPMTIEDEIAALIARYGADAVKAAVEGGAA